MTSYISSITGYINSFIYTLNYVGNHLSSFPGLAILLGLWVIIFSVLSLQKLSN